MAFYGTRRYGFLLLGIAIALQFLQQAPCSAGWMHQGELAFRATKNGETEKAIHFYIRAIEEARNSKVSSDVVADLLLNLCQCQIQANQLRAAEASLRLAMKAMPVHGEVEGQKIRMLRRKSSLEAARAQWSDAERTQGQLVSLVEKAFGKTSRYVNEELTRLGIFQFENGNVKGVIETGLKQYQSMLAQGFRSCDPDMISKALWISTMMLEAGRLDDAQKLLDQTLKNVVDAKLGDQQMLVTAQMFQISLMKGDLPGRKKWMNKLVYLYSLPQASSVSAYNRVQSMLSVLSAYQKANVFGDEFARFADMTSRTVEQAKPLLKPEQYYLCKSQASWYRVWGLVNRDKMDQAVEASNWVLPSGVFHSGWDFLCFEFCHSLLANTFEKQGNYKSSLEQIDILIDAYKRNPYGQEPIRKWQDLRAKILEKQATHSGKSFSAVN